MKLSISAWIRLPTESYSRTKLVRSASSVTRLIRAALPLNSPIKGLKVLRNALKSSCDFDLQVFNVLFTAADFDSRIFQKDVLRFFFPDRNPIKARFWDRAFYFKTS